MIRCRSEESDSFYSFMSREDMGLFQQQRAISNNDQLLRGRRELELEMVRNHNNELCLSNRAAWVRLVMAPKHPRINRLCHVQDSPNQQNGTVAKKKKRKQNTALFFYKFKYQPTPVFSLSPSSFIFKLR